MLSSISNENKTTTTPKVPSLNEGVSKVSLRGAKRRSNPRKGLENKEIATLLTVARNDKT
jgi:hypothetical protein